MDLSELLSLSIKEGASDLHLSAGLSPILRIDGDLVQTDLPIMNSDLVDKLIYEVLNDRQIAIVEDGAEIDFSFEIPHVAWFRANVFNQNRGRAGIRRGV
jgi:twitching motility protein PilT